MKKFLNVTLAVVFYLTISNSAIAQNVKIRSNKEIAMEFSINTYKRAVTKWISQAYHQASCFIIQRSRNNEDFSDVREIYVKQNNVEEGQRLQFTFIDSKLLTNEQYYRILEYELDAISNNYSSIIVKTKSPISIVRDGDISLLRVMVEDSKDLVALVTTETGLGVPCEFEAETSNYVLLKPAYSLNGGSYLVKLRSSAGESQYKFTVKSDDIL
jgi:hypothetical protein